MHYAQIKIDSRVGARRNLNNPNAYKGMLWHLFDHHNLPENSGGWVFKVNRNPSTGCYTFLVMSRFDPNPDALIDDGIKVETREVSDEIFSNGTKLLFRTRINPVIRISETHRRVPMETNNIPLWVANKLSAGAIVACEVEHTGTQISYKKGNILSHFYADVRGGLVITDGKAFVESLANGIGHAKRYGFGLLEVSAKRK